MRFRMRILLGGLVVLAVSSPVLRSASGDVEGSSDYPGLPRPPGFVISDYDEDNPSLFDFSVARPLPTDAAHIETVHVKGHRFIIRYELASGASPLSLLQIQQYYEKLLANAGFTVEKTGAVGDVTETFHQKKAGREVWVYLEPERSANVLTVMESREVSLPSVSEEEEEDSLYTDLMEKGHAVFPLSFPPGKSDLGPEAQPIIDRVVTILQRHPDLSLRIEGHTDNAGDPADNQKLSATRARAVRALLIEGGVEKERLQAVGLGGLEPVADNSTAEGREKNRRIELVVRRESPSFHAPAPNGMNYYPSAGTSSTSR